MGGQTAQTTTTTQKSQPWNAAKPGLKQAIGGAQDLYNAGGFAADPYAGARVAPQSAATLQGQQMLMNAAGNGMPLSQQASGALANMLDGNWQSGMLDAVKQEALGSAVPAAVAQFAGSGMTNSGAAMDAVSRAAMGAVAPYEYDAFNNMQTNALRAAAFAPQLDQTVFMPGQVMGQVGAAQDAYSQAVEDAAMASYYEGQNQPMNNLGGFTNMMMGLGGMGGTQLGQSTVPGASTGQRVGGAALGGLGAYGALAANPLTAPFAIAGGLGAGLLGLF